MGYVDQILPEVIPAAPGCPDEIARRAIRSAAMEFFRDSQVWRVTITGAAAIAGFREVSLPIPGGTFVQRVYWVRLSGRDLKGVSERWIGTDEVRGRPTEYAVPPGSKTLLLNPIPTTNELSPGLTAHLALVPGFDTVSIPEDLVERYRMALVHGGIRNVLATPGASWANTRLAGDYAHFFETAKTQARRAGDADNAPITRKVRYGGI